HDVRQLRVPLARLELACVRLARVVHDAVDEARVVDELHLDHEGRARPVLAPDVQDRELGPLRQGSCSLGRYSICSMVWASVRSSRSLSRPRRMSGWVAKIRRKTKSFFRSAKAMPYPCPSERREASGSRRTARTRLAASPGIASVRHRAGQVG